MGDSGGLVTTALTVVGGTAIIYISALVAVRIAGRRTVAQLSAFDVVVTIALGSLVASTAVTPDPSYVQGLVAMMTLLSMQLIVGAVRQRVPAVQRALDFEPDVLVRNGSFSLNRSIFGPQLSESDVLSKLRQHGVFEMEDVQLVTLEPDGSISIIRRGSATQDPAT